MSIEQFIAMLILFPSFLLSGIIAGFYEVIFNKNPEESFTFVYNLSSSFMMIIFSWIIFIIMCNLIKGRKSK